MAEETTETWVTIELDEVSLSNLFQIYHVWYSYPEDVKYFCNCCTTAKLASSINYNRYMVAN